LIATDVAARGIDIPGVELVIQIEPPQSVETYIHRSGRTGRANAHGTAITFYTPKQYFWLQQIERKGGVKFQRPGVPQKTDIIEAALKGVNDQLSKVHKDVLPMFAKAATDMIEQRVSQDGDDDKTERTAIEESAERERAATEALAACLAVITGHTQPIKPRSLLLSAQDWVTVMVKTNTQIRSLSFIWNIVRKNLWEQPDDKVKGMRMLADSTGAVFDIPCNEEDKVNQVAEQTWFKMSIPTELPKLVEMVAERPPDRPRPWMKDRRSGGGGGGRGGSRGGGSRGGSFRGRK
jgi:ATP-dependent RNA helicase DDX21